MILKTSEIIVLKKSLPIFVSSLALTFGILFNSKFLANADENNLYWLSLLIPYSNILNLFIQMISITAMNITIYYKDTDCIKDRDLHLSNLNIIGFILILILSILSIIINTFYLSNEMSNKYFSNFCLIYIIFNIPLLSFCLLYSSYYTSSNKIFKCILINCSSVLFCAIINYLILKYFINSAYSISFSILITYITYYNIVKYYFYNSFNKNKLSWNNFIKTFVIFKNIGLPIGLIYFSYIIGAFIYNNILSIYSDQYLLSAYGVILRIQGFILIPSISIGIATGLLINEKKMNLIEDISFLKNIFIIVIIFYTFVSFFCYHFSYLFVDFITNSSIIREKSIKILKYISISYISLGPLLFFLSVLEQTGYGLKSFLLSILGVIFQVLLSLYFCNFSSDNMIFFKIYSIVNITYFPIIVFYICYNKKYKINFSKIRI
jgi:Na+-driven multidrug efflux pump